MPDLTVRAQLDPKETLRRIVSARFEVRQKSEGKVELEGYASTTEQPYEMQDMFGSYSEVISRGAFAQTIAQGADVALLLNHGGLTMARTKSGSLTLSEDEHGLHWLGQVNASRSDVRDMLASIEDGDVDECSFAFRVTRQQWSPDYDERRILEINLNRGDVCPVNFGANPTTSIGGTRSVSSEPSYRAWLEGMKRALPAEDFSALAKRLDAVTAELVGPPAEPAGMSLGLARLHLG